MQSRPHTLVFKTNAALLLPAFITIQSLTSVAAASKTPALGGENLDDGAVFLQQQARLDALHNSFMQEVDTVDKDQAMRVFKMISNIAKNTSIPREERSMVLLQEAGKVMGAEMNPITDFWEWFKTEPKNYRSQSVSAPMWFRNILGPGRKSVMPSCRIAMLLLLPIGIIESIMGIAASLSCEESEETALVCQAEPLNAAKSMIYTVAYTQYAASWCAPTHKVEYLCGAAAAETLSKLGALTQATMKLGGMCTDAYTYVVEGGEKQFQCMFNSARLAGYFLVSLNHIVKYITRSKADYSLEHSVTSTVFDLFSSVTWVANLLVLVLRDCGNKDIKKSDCGTKAGETLAYILGYGAAESRRRDYCLDKLNKRGARHSAPPGTHPLKGLDSKGRPVQVDDEDEDEDDVDDMSSVTSDSTYIGSIPMDDMAEYDPSDELIINRHKRASSALGVKDVPEFQTMWSNDGDDVSDDELVSSMSEDFSQASQSEELPGFKVYNNPTFAQSPLPPIGGGPPSSFGRRPRLLPPLQPFSPQVLGAPLRQTMSDDDAEEVRSVILPGTPPLFGTPVAADSE